MKVGYEPSTTLTQGRWTLDKSSSGYMWRIQSEYLLGHSWDWMMISRIRYFVNCPNKYCEIFEEANLLRFWKQLYYLIEQKFRARFKNKKRYHSFTVKLVNRLLWNIVMSLTSGAYPINMLQHKFYSMNIFKAPLLVDKFEWPIRMLEKLA